VGHRAADAAVGDCPTVPPAGKELDVARLQLNPGRLVVKAMRGGQNKLRFDQSAGAEAMLAQNKFAHRIPAARVVGGLQADHGGVISPDTLNDYLRPISVVRPLK
jgi:hypothetical protein